MSRQTDRRRFLQEGALAGVGFWVAGGVSSGRPEGAGERLNIACIGVGGKGGSDTDQAARFGNVVALCDIDDNTLNARAASHRKARKFNDFREMLDKMGKAVDAVTVSTPDHTHAVAA